MKLYKNHSNQIFLAIFLLLFMTKIEAQSYDTLYHLEGHHITTYYSGNAYKQAEMMGTLCDSVLIFYRSIIEFEPTVTLLVLSPDDWRKYSGFPVYGMPHIIKGQTLVVASEDNDFWRSFIPPLDHLPKELANQISTTYSDSDNTLTMRSFFNLLAIHELGHAFHIQGGLKMQRKWMEELFANMFLHTFVAEKEAQFLPALTLFPKIIITTTNSNELKYNSLDELEANYTQITQQYPNNYGWFQCRLHMAAGKIYDEEGIDAFQHLWHMLKNQDEHLDDSSLAKLLSKRVSQTMADVLLKWNE